LVVFAVIWAFLFFKAYKERQLRDAAKSRPATEPARQRDALSAAAAAGAFSPKGQESRTVEPAKRSMDAGSEERSSSAGRATGT